MNDKDAKELIKQLQRMNKNLEKLTEAVEKSNNYNYKITPTYASIPTDCETKPIYKSEPIDPFNPYIVNCNDTSTTANPPYYGTKVDTTTYGVVGADWTNKDSLEALH